MSEPIDYPGEGLVYLDDAQLDNLRHFANTTIASGDYLSGARLRALLEAYPRAEEAADIEQELSQLRDDGKELGIEIAQLHTNIEKIEADLDEQISVLHDALTPVPVVAPKGSKKNAQIARQAHLLDIEGAANRLIDALGEISSRLAQVKESLKSQANDVTEWCGPKPEEKKT